MKPAAGERSPAALTLEVFYMEWWIWMLIAIAALFFILDWIIVMGADPRKWKGGDKK